MNQGASFSANCAYFCAFGAAVASLFSIAVCHTLLALSVAALLFSPLRLRLPFFWKPLAAFMVWTVVSVAASASPADGRAQLRKFYVYLLVLVLFSALPGLVAARRLLLILAGIGIASGLKGLFQFQQKSELARMQGMDFYQFYVGDRITGFMSHWMTFAGEMMIVLLVLGAFLFFSRRPVRALPAWLAGGAIVGAAIVLGFTRSIWAATAAGALYLLWFWRRWTVLILPVVAAAAFFLAPEPVRERIRSAYRPDQRLDSNLHRDVLRRVGWRMILDHPLTGVGPEHVERRLPSYVPSEVRPLFRDWWYGHLHNIYVHYAAERGLPALAALLSFFGMLLTSFIRALRRLPAGPGDERFILHAALAVTLGILVCGWWELNLGDSEVLTAFLAVVTCGAIAAEAAPLPVADSPAPEQIRAGHAA